MGDWPKERLRAAVPYVVGAVLVVALTRSVVATPFFLLPIAFLAEWREGRYLWPATGLSIILNTLAALLISKADLVSFGFIADTLYFGGITIIFAWAVSGRFFSFIRRPYRFAIAAALSALVIVPILSVAKNTPDLLEYIEAQAEVLSQALIEASGSDVVQQSLVENSIDTAFLIDTIFSVMMRGLSFAHFLVFAVNWRLASLFVRKRRFYQRSDGPLITFRNDNIFIWILLGSSLILLGGLFTSNALIEISAWNIVSLCATLYGIQGYGILLYNISRPTLPRFLRPLLSLIILFSLLRPGLNAIVALTLVLAGVAETWLPLRPPISSGPTSTPEA